MLYVMLAAFLTIVGVTCASPVSGREDKIEYVIDKLEDYALSEDANLAGSGLTMAELTEAYQQYASFDAEGKKALRESSPVEKLVVDLLLIPLDRTYKPVLFFGDETDPDSIEAQKNFIRMVETSYRKFRPSYLGRTISNQIIVMKKCDALFGPLFDGTAPLTGRLFEAAERELRWQEMRLDEILEHEDVYKNLGVFEAIRNTLNGFMAKILRLIILPIYHTSKTTGGKIDFQEIQSMILEEMKKRKISVNKNQ